ncbi:MAG: hypothetical protein HUU01_11350 [Saprospiraceae bacterium]|nr:hypothetical protein [Saprospiraceae bacterium]
MKNVGIGRPFLSLASSFLFCFSLTTVFGQKLTLSVAATGTGVEVKTIYEQIANTSGTNNYVDPLDTLNGETSFGLFYRIDSDPTTNNNASLNAGSYYWRDDIVYPNKLALSKIIDLPPGKYSIVAYLSRKSKPIRTINLSGTMGSGFTLFEVPAQDPNNLALNGFEAVDMTTGSTPSTLKLENSWNVFTDRAIANTATDHLIFNASSNVSGATPTQPWFFITLSVENSAWVGQDISMIYNPIFEYKGLIFGNKANDISSNSWISGEDKSKIGTVIIKRGMLPKNLSHQTHIHFMFQLKPEVLYPPGYVKFTAQFETGPPVTLDLAVKPKPHDPNSLTVNKKTICPCDKALELHYRVDFQNIGTGPVKDVRVVLMDTDGLDVSSLAPFGDKTLKKGVPMMYHRGPRGAPAPTFEIPGINLPGTNQAPPNSVPDDETWDYFDFTVSTTGCLKDNTFIRPKARVFFSDVPGYLDTNIGETHVLYSAGESTDGPPQSCVSRVDPKACRGCLVIKERRN